MDKLGIGRARAAAFSDSADPEAVLRGEARERAQRRPGEAARLARDGARRRARSPATTPKTPGERAAQKQPRDAVERALRRPGAAAWRSSARASAAAYSSRSPARIASAASSRGDERLVDPVARERVDEPGRVADEQHASAPRSARRAVASAADAREGRVSASGSTPCASSQPGEVVAQARPFVPSRRRRGSRGRPSGRPSRSRRGRRRARHRRCRRYARRLEVAPRDVPLERDAVDDPVAEPGRARDDAVRAVGADERTRLDARAADVRTSRCRRSMHDRVDPRAVAEVRSRRGACSAR